MNICNSDTKLVGVNQPTSGRIYDPLYKMEPIPDTAWVDENLTLDRLGTEGKREYSCFAKGL